MNRREIFIDGCVAAGACVARRLLRPALLLCAVAERGRRDLRPVAQPVGAVGDDGFPDREAGQDGGVLAVARTGSDLVHRYRIVGIDQIDIVARRTAQHCRCRHEHGLACSVSTSILTLTNSFGKSASSSLAKVRAQRDRAGAGGHLIAERVERAGRDLLVVIAGVCGDRQLRAGVEALDHLVEIVLGTVNSHRRRLHRGDDDDAGRARGGDIVAGIDQAQADPAGDRRGDVAIHQVELELRDIRPGRP